MRYRRLYYGRKTVIFRAVCLALALLIAQECLPYLRGGISNRVGLQRAADIVRAKLPGFQTAFTDRERVLAASGFSPAETPLPVPAAEAMARVMVPTPQ